MFRYKSLFDDCLVVPLTNKDGLNTWEIQVRQDISATHFAIGYTNGYKFIACTYAKGWQGLKDVIEKYKLEHESA